MSELTSTIIERGDLAHLALFFMGKRCFNTAGLEHAAAG